MASLAAETWLVGSRSVWLFILCLIAGDRDGCVGWLIIVARLRHRSWCVSSQRLVVARARAELRNADKFIRKKKLITTATIAVSSTSSAAKSSTVHLDNNGHKYTLYSTTLIVKVSHLNHYKLNKNFLYCY